MTLVRYALDQGAASVAVDLQDSTDGIPFVKALKKPIQRRKVHANTESSNETYNLFAFPSECNFSGLKFGLELVDIIKNHSERFLGDSSLSKNRWMVLIDAAKGCATQPPDLSKHPADFVVISFYKLFGYPTGLGALLVRNDAAKLFRQNYFSGGTVLASFADIDLVKRRESIEEAFEHGTASFLSIASIRHGFKILNRLTVPAITRHVASLTTYVRKVLLSMKHKNGNSVIKLYGTDFPKSICSISGSVVTFNVKRPDGSWFGHRELEKLASLSSIQLRTGCFCNPGACAKNLDLSHQNLLSNLEAGHICWDDNDIIQGKPTGAVRISFGYMSAYEDAKKFIDFIFSSFVSNQNEEIVDGLDKVEETASCSAKFYLKSITVYPIKSCGGFCVERWPLCSTGLLYDREWVLRSVTGEILTQKKVPEMHSIKTSLLLCEEALLVNSPACKSTLRISLEPVTDEDQKEEIILHSKRYIVGRNHSDVNSWFSTAVGRPCVLLRHVSAIHHCPNEATTSALCRDVFSVLSFANEGQFLLVLEESVADLNTRLRGKSEAVSAARLRPNLVISGGRPYVEDSWRNIEIGSSKFVSLGGCNRCHMINYVYQNGKVLRPNEPLATLASYRRIKGKILFGILLRHEPDVDFGQHQLQVGQEVQPYE